MSLKKNVVANYLGQAWRAVMALAFIPVYIRYLGIEVYALIGLFATLQACLGLLDLGLRPALSREMARYIGGAINLHQIRTLLRSAEVVGFIGAGLITIGVLVAAAPLATGWVTAKTIPVDAIARAFTIMGLVSGMAFLESMYASCLAGLQRQVLQNLITSAMATLRGFGAVAILIWVSPTIEGYFLWQTLVSLLTLALFAAFVYRTLPRTKLPVHFSWLALRGIWRFAAGMLGISLLALLLMQVDKILISRLLTLEAFGYYVLAGSIAGVLSMIAGPVAFAFYPRFTELIARGKETELRQAYHLAAQLSTMLLAPTAAMFVIFGKKLLVMWTGNQLLSAEAAPLLSILAIGTLFNSHMLIPYYLQLSYGWTALAIKINIAAVIALVPALFWLVPRHGPLGAASVWLALNIIYFTVNINLMHRKLLTNEKWRWYIHDITIPTLAALAAALAWNLIIPSDLERSSELVFLLFGGAVTLAASLIACSEVRLFLARRMRRQTAQRNATS